MNNKLLIIIMSIISLNISSASVFATNWQVNDTIPEGGAKIDTSSQVTDPADFADIESELDSLSPRKSATDTTTIRIGKMKISVMEDGKDIVIDKEEWENESDDDSWDWKGEDFGDKHKNKHKRSKKDGFEPHWAGFAMGLNNYAAADYSLSLPSDYRYMDLNTNISYQGDLNVADLGINLIKHRVGLVTGVGIRWNNYKFSNTNLILIKGADSLEYKYDSSQNYSKSKLTISYLTIPLLLEVQIPIQSKELYLAAGVEGSLKLGAHTKTITESDNKTKNHSDFYISHFAANLTARAGYGDFGIYATYNLTPLFKENQGPELYPYCMGVSLNF